MPLFQFDGLHFYLFGGERVIHFYGIIIVTGAVVGAWLATREAKRQGKSLRAHYAHLVVHGILHLRGYDHQRASDAARMERAEIRILRRLGFADPYLSAAPVE